MVAAERSLFVIDGAARKTVNDSLVEFVPRPEVALAHVLGWILPYDFVQMVFIVEDGLPDERVRLVRRNLTHALPFLDRTLLLSRIHYGWQLRGPLRDIDLTVLHSFLDQYS